MSIAGWLSGCLALLLSSTPVLAEGYALLDETAEGEVDIRAELHVEGDWPADGQAWITFSYADDRNHLYLAMNKRGWSLGEFRDGVETSLGSAGGWPSPAREGVYQIVIKRRAWSIRVLCDGRLMLMAYEQFAPGDRVGFAARKVSIEDLYTQPIGEMMFHDDFARPPDEPDPWEQLVGAWRISLPESRNKQSEPAKSANPFSFAATGPKALAVAGSAFWDGYAATAAVKPGASGYVGLACYVEDAENYYVFRLSADESASADAEAQLVRVIHGQESVIATAPACLLTGKWYRLGITAHDGRLSGSLDGKVLCATTDDTFSEGRLGLYTLNCARASFDDIALERSEEYGDDFGPSGIIPVEQLAGTWDIAGGELLAAPDPDLLTAIGLTGCRQWRDYRLTVDVTAANAPAVGLYFGCTGPQDYYLFRWGLDRGQPNRDVQELWKVAGGQSELLASRTVRLNRTARQRIALTLDRNYIAAAVDGELALDCVDFGRASEGQVGYYAEGSRGVVARFDNMHVAFCPPPVEPVSITAQFAKEDTMADWARPIASWPGMGNRVYRWDLPVWGDFDLRIGLQGNSLKAARTVALLMAATAEGIRQAGPVVELKTEKGSPEVLCAVTGGEAGKGQFGEQDPLFELQRRGGCLLVLLDGAPMAWARVPDGEQAPFIGLKLGGLGVNLNDVALTSPRIVDAGFTGAPTEWLPQSGEWDISDRWNCQPQWSWFCGRNDDSPLLWSKQAFSGDMVFEYWAGVMMDLPQGPGYSHPSDLNGVLCGDGEDLCSGYAVVLAGDNNTRGKILRKGETVAESTSVKFDNPTTANLNGFHRHWFHVRVEKIGGHITMYVDGQKALEYEDKAPLSGGKVGLWTYQGNGMMVARTRVAWKG